MIDTDWRPSPRKLRQFAALLLVVPVVLVLLHGRALWIAALGSIALLGLFWPAIVRPVYVGLTIVSLPIGWAVSHILLRVIYYLILTPVGFLLRLGGRDPLRLKNPNSESYWLPFQQDADIESYFRQT